MVVGKSGRPEGAGRPEIKDRRKKNVWNIEA